MHICANSKDEIPFEHKLENWSFAPNVEIHLDKNGKSSIDLNRILSSPKKDTLIYVCGPPGFNKWVLETAREMGWSKDQFKQEIFSRDNTGLSPASEFELILKKSAKSITVNKDATIIDALHFNNISVPYSCLQGTCGTCITNVVEGKIDHRDAVLSEEERLENKKICLCVSRSNGNRLIIDI